MNKSKMLDKYIKDNNNFSDVDIINVSNIANKFEVGENYVYYKLIINGIERLEWDYEPDEIQALDFIEQNKNNLKTRNDIINIAIKYGVDPLKLKTYCMRSDIAIVEYNDMSGLIVKYLYDNRLNILNGNMSDIEKIAKKFLCSKANINKYMRYTIPTIYHILNKKEELARIRHILKDDVFMLKDINIMEVSNKYCLAPGVISKMILKLQSSSDFKKYVKEHNLQPTNEPKLNKKYEILKYLDANWHSLCNVKMSTKDATIVQLANMFDTTPNYIHSAINSYKKDGMGKMRKMRARVYKYFDSIENVELIDCLTKDEIYKISNECKVNIVTVPKLFKRYKDNKQLE